jgi:hypothetical protein
MSAQPLTFEGVLKLITQQGDEFDRRMKETERMIRENAAQMKETDRQMKETDRQMKETDRIVQETAKQIEKTNQNVGALGSRIGDIIENMVGGRIIDKFQALGYEVDDYVRKHAFQNKKLGIAGQIDLMLHDGDVAILIEVKTTLEITDVRKHLERMEKYRRYANAFGYGKHMRFVGAVAGAVIEGDAVDFAHANGLYTIVQSGEGVEIVPTPEGLQAKEW